MIDVWVLGYAVPTAVVLLGGIAYLFANRRRSHRATGLALAALFGLLLVLGYQVAIQPFVFAYVIDQRGRGQDVATILGIHSLLLAVVRAVPLGLLIAAVVVDRRSPTSLDDE